MNDPTLGQLVRSFFGDHLQLAKGLRRSSLQSYRDVLRLFLAFVAGQVKCNITTLALEDLTFDQVLSFLRHLEMDRKNSPQTRNQRLAVLHIFFDYLAQRIPEMLPVGERVVRIPPKRTPPPETRFLEREEVQALLDGLLGQDAHRDRTLLLFLYNTGARAQEVADLRIGHIDWDPPRVRLHGKGNKWRLCPLWPETLQQLRALLGSPPHDPDAPVFVSQRGCPLGRFGIYKLVRRHASQFDRPQADPAKGRITPHVFRHTTAVHLLEAGVEVNVIRGWLGHTSLKTTNRYAEINAAAKEKALHACEPPGAKAIGKVPSWQEDKDLLAWLNSL
jgi:site-specific recombinase XerD